MPRKKKESNVIQALYDVITKHHPTLIDADTQVLETVVHELCTVIGCLVAAYTCSEGLEGVKRMEKLINSTVTDVAIKMFESVNVGLIQRGSATLQ